MSESKRLLEPKSSQDKSEEETYEDVDKADSSVSSKIRRRQSPGYLDSASSSMPANTPTETNLSPSTTTKYGTLHSSTGFKRTLLVDTYPRTNFTKKQFAIAFLSLLLFVAAVAITLAFGLPRLEAKRNEYYAAQFLASSYEEKSFLDKSVLVSSSNQPECSKIGHDVLSRQNGSVIDSVLATLFCVQMASPHLVGLDSGFSLLYYSKQNRTGYAISSEEQSLPLPQTNNISHFKAVSLPTLVESAYSVHNRFGRLEWSSILEPTVKLANSGISVSKQLAKVLSENQIKLFSVFKSISDQFSKISNSTSATTNQNRNVLEEGDLYQNPMLAKTLQLFANSKHDQWYNSSWVETLVQDINVAVLNNRTNNDLPTKQTQLETNTFVRNQKHHIKDYFKTEKTLSVSLFNQTLNMLSSPFDKGSIVMAKVLTILKRLITNPQSNIEPCNDNNRSLKEGTYEFHYSIEAIKFGAAILKDLLSNPDKVVDLESPKESEAIDDIVNKIMASIEQQQFEHEPSYYGFENVDVEPASEKNNLNSNNNIQIIVYDAQSGDVATLTTTKSHSLFEGQKVISPTTGLVLDLFKEESLSTKQCSAIVPALFLDPSNDQIRLASGAIGGENCFQIPAALSQVLYKFLLNCQSLKTATDESRFFYLEDSNQVLYEPNFPQAYLDLLVKMFGHYNLEPTTFVSGWKDTAVYSVYRTEDKFNSANNSSSFQLRTMVDSRHGGTVKGN